VPAGEYFVVAIPEVDVGDYPDVPMLDALTRVATRFAMASGERKAIDLVVKAVK
jgi:predicted RNA-binding protein with TRAM domain